MMSARGGSDGTDLGAHAARTRSTSHHVLLCKTAVSADRLQSTPQRCFIHLGQLHAGRDVGDANHAWDLDTSRQINRRHYCP